MFEFSASSGNTKFSIFTLFCTDVCQKEKKTLTSRNCDQNEVHEQGKDYRILTSKKSTEINPQISLRTTCKSRLRVDLPRIGTIICL